VCVRCVSKSSFSFVRSRNITLVESGAPPPGVVVLFPPNPPHWPCCSYLAIPCRVIESTSILGTVFFWDPPSYPGWMLALRNPGGLLTFLMRPSWRTRLMNPSLIDGDSTSKLRSKDLDPRPLVLIFFFSVVVHVFPRLPHSPPLFSHAFFFARTLFVFPLWRVPTWANSFRGVDEAPPSKAVTIFGWRRSSTLNPLSCER